MKNLHIKIAFLFLIICTNTYRLSAQSLPVSITSPDKKLVVKVGLNAKLQPYYSVLLNDQVVLQPSSLGIVTVQQNFTEQLKVKSVSAIIPIVDNYKLYTGKKTQVQYKANRQTFKFVNKNGKELNLIFQVSNDGVVFRYFLPEINTNVTITNETTSFKFDTSTIAFLQPIAVAKTGYEGTNPSYEENYQQAIKVGTPSTNGAGWVYPALFNFKNTWVLITEAALDSNYCATRLQHASPNGDYSIGFADPREVITGKGYLPHASVPFYSPWRVITVGSLKTIMESTLGTDVASPAKKFDQSFIHPGKSSWSWIMSKDDHITYDEQIRYIDFAADMHWQYCLIDAGWDKKIGYEKVKALAVYAAAKKVNMLMWYNSAGDWNTVPLTPKNKLLTHEARIKEFSLLKEMGVKGFKMDFFGGDGQSMIQYYIDILNDAAAFGLLANFHGATLPRGWQRTYPHLLTTEAVKGFEMVTFFQHDADVQANHCAMLPFARNVFDPMDFTPMNLSGIYGNVKRKTNPGFELALSVIFTSGIQHFAESPEGMSKVPDYVKDAIKQLPDQWDEVKYLEGYPGKYVVLARRAGNKWWIAGINGENIPRTIKIELSQFNKNKASFITDGLTKGSFLNEQLLGDAAKIKQIELKPSGGFIMILE